MKLNAIIVDDEPLARNFVVNLLESVTALRIKGTYGTGKEAIIAINHEKPDILFLDIQLKDMTGFEVLEKIEVKTPLTIFTTAFDSYAIEAFNIFAFDYLLKPYTENRFYQSVFKAIETLGTKNDNGTSERMDEFLIHVQNNNQKAVKLKSRIPIPSGGKTVFVKQENINYILASNYYAEIHTEQKKYLLRDSMYNLMKELDSNLFVRIHRSSIVNLNCVDELINSAYGEIDVKMNGGQKLRVSRSYRKAFLMKVGVNK